MREDCSILLLSCDRNKGLLNIFFDIFQKNWSDCPFPVYLGIEEMNMHYDGVITLKSSKQYWAARILDYLNQIPSKYILLIMDDFVLEGKVDTNRMLDYLEILKQRSDVAVITVAEIHSGNNPQSEYPDLLYRDKKSNYLFNLQVAFWKKELFVKLLREKETPWQTEVYGSIRATGMKDYQFLSLKSDDISPYKYGRGWLMQRGIWNASEIVRMGLQKYANDIFDGKDIKYKNHYKYSMLYRIKMRILVGYRKILAKFGIYL